MRERLLLEHVHAPLERGEGGADVLVVRGGDVHGVGTERVDQLLGAREGRQPRLGGGALPRGGVDVRDADELEPVDRLDRPDVDDGDVPVADQTDATLRHEPCLLAAPLRHLGG